MKKILFAVALLLTAFSPLQAQYLNSGYRGMLELGFGVGNRFDRAEYAPDARSFAGHLEVSTTHGYQFNPYLFLGGGVGVLCRDITEDGTTFPFFADFRANFNKKKNSPYGVLKIGYSMSPEDELKGGVYFNPSLGYRFGIYKKLAMNVSLGYLFQQADFYESGGIFCIFFCRPEHISRGVLNAITAKVGIEF